MITSIAASGLGGYISGIITGGCGQRNLDHTVLIVGQGYENGVQYWTVRNSWGMGFGEAGYFRMQYGVCCMGFCGGGNCQTYG
jgi:C1A family cysteine protease